MMVCKRGFEIVHIRLNTGWGAICQRLCRQRRRYGGKVALSPIRCLPSLPAGNVDLMFLKDALHPPSTRTVYTTPVDICYGQKSGELGDADM